MERWESLRDQSSGVTVCFLCAPTYFKVCTSTVSFVSSICGILSFYLDEIRQLISDVGGIEYARVPC
jgi:hypothetical protein